jgi:hypothetical protein
MTTPQRIAYDKFNPQREFPFVDFGNHFVVLGASSSPSVLEGLSLVEIGKDLDNGKSPVALAIVGSANYFVAALCTMVQSNAPAICSSPVTLRAAKDLALGAGPSPKATSASTAPVQPPTNAPISAWKKWSVEEHRFVLAAAANYRSPNPACTILNISVNANKSNKTVLGVPPGITRWAMSIKGRCPSGHDG